MPIELDDLLKLPAEANLGRESKVTEYVRHDYTVSQQLKDVIGCSGYIGPPRSLKEMEEALVRGARESEAKA